MMKVIVESKESTRADQQPIRLEGHYDIIIKSDLLFMYSIGKQSQLAVDRSFDLFIAQFAARNLR